MAFEEQKITATFPINLLSIPIWIWELSPWWFFSQHQERSYITTNCRLWTHPLSFCSHGPTSRLAMTSVLRGTPEWTPPAGSPVGPSPTNQKCEWGSVRAVLYSLRKNHESQSLSLVCFHTCVIPNKFFGFCHISLCLHGWHRLFLSNKNFDNFTDNVAGQQEWG